MTDHVEVLKALLKGYARDSVSVERIAIKEALDAAIRALSPAGGDWVAKEGDRALGKNRGYALAAPPQQEPGATERAFTEEVGKDDKPTGYLLFESAPSGQTLAGAGDQTLACRLLSMGYVTEEEITHAQVCIEQDKMEDAYLREFERQNADFVNALPRRIDGSNPQPAAAQATATTSATQEMVVDCELSERLAELVKLEGGTANLCFMADNLRDEGSASRARDVMAANTFIDKQKAVIDLLLSRALTAEKKLTATSAGTTGDGGGFRLPELPQPFDYCYEWDGPYGRRKFSSAPHNGRIPDKTTPLYTSDQMYVYASEAISTTRQASTADDAADALRYRWLRDNCHHNQHTDREWPHAVIMLQWLDPDGCHYNRFHPDKNAPGVGLISLDKALDHVMQIDAARRAREVG